MSNFGNCSSAALSKYCDQSLVHIDHYKNMRFSLETPATSYWKNDIESEIDNIDHSDEEEIIVSEMVKERSKMLLERLPYEIKPPSLGIEPNGAILFEWHSKVREREVSIFSIILDEEKIIYSAFNLYDEDRFGEDAPRGITPLSEFSIDSIISPILTKYFNNDAWRLEARGHSI